MEKEIIGNWGFEYFAIIHHQLDISCAILRHGQKQF